MIESIKELNRRFVASLTLEERLEGLSPEERLRGLASEDRAQLLKPSPDSTCQCRGRPMV